MKDPAIVNRQFVAGVAITLILCIALLIPGGVSQGVGATLSAQPQSLQVSKPKSLEVSKPKTLKVSEPKFLEVSKPKSTEVSKPKSFKSGVFLNGNYTRAERENAEYLRCAAQQGFDDRHKCAFEAIGR
jgi:hypothetical protein